VDGPAKAALTRVAKRIAEAQAAIATATAELSVLQDEARTMMTRYGIEEFKTAHGVHEMYTPRSNLVRTIDPRQFYDVVSEDQFFQSCKIELASAKRFLSTLQLDDMIDERKGAKKPVEYKFTSATPVKKPSRAKKK